jgi:hypothetical protein
MSDIAELRREVSDLREELELVSGGYEARLARRRQHLDEIERLRGELGLSRAHRRQLRDQISANAARHAQTEVCLQRARADLKKAHARLHDLAGKMCIDGQLLSELIIGSCPVMLADHAAADIARDTVDELDRIGPGVYVFRGQLDRPWSPQPRNDTPQSTAANGDHTDGCAPASVNMQNPDDLDTRKPASTPVIAPTAASGDDDTITVRYTPGEPDGAWSAVITLSGKTQQPDHAPG